MAENYGGRRFIKDSVSMRLYCPFQGVRNRTASNIVKKNILVVSDHAKHLGRLLHSRWEVFTGHVAECTVLQVTNSDGDCIVLIAAS